jgi:Ca2+-binding RTX toxin-like protein
LGRDGHDLINGGRGRDVLVGGDGADAIYGGGDDDILIAGRINLDLEDQALCDIADRWNSTDDYGTRIANLRADLLAVVLNDSTPVNDLLGGGSSAGDDDDDDRRGPRAKDWYFADTNASLLTRDRVTKRSGEVVEEL